MASPSVRSRSPDLGELEFEDLDLNEQRRLFRKLNTKTSYCLQFGEPPKAAEDFVVMKEKKFRELEFSKYFNPLPAIYLEKWLSLG